MKRLNKIFTGPDRSQPLSLTQKEITSETLPKLRTFDGRTSSTLRWEGTKQLLFYIQCEPPIITRFKLTFVDA